MAAALGTLASLWLATTNILSSAHVPAAASRSVAGAVTTLILWVLWRNYRTFSRASRVEQPDAFTLHPTVPASLVGRSEVLRKLVALVKQCRLVLVDGQSGCGKSALVTAGLVPTLLQTGDLVPVLISDWGSHWVRGPLAAALDALFNVLTTAEKGELRWTSRPDLAADTTSLRAELERRLNSVTRRLGKRVLLIADQFDDYQASHQQDFWDAEGNWLTPLALAEVNPFWDFVARALSAGQLHLLVLTRDDTASGLSCVRFLPEEQLVNRTLPRVEADYVRPLLRDITSDQAIPPIVSNPENGWFELRERLELDLRSEGALLMQQVRTILLGLRQMPLLGPGYYRAAGGLRGVEMLAVTQAVHRAADAIGSGEANRRAVRAILGKLVLRGAVDQPPRGQRASLNDLCQASSSSVKDTSTVLESLHAAEIVRPVATSDPAEMWQLDHDYLARAVIADARQANQLRVIIGEGKARYDCAATLRGRFAALLPVTTLARAAWAHARNRLVFGDTASYILISAVKPTVAAALLFVGAVSAYSVQRNSVLNAEALRIIDRLGGSSESEAVFEVWSGSDELRQRVRNLVERNGDAFERALRSGWPMADAGLDAGRSKHFATVLHGSLSRPGYDFSRAYCSVAKRMRGADAAAEAHWLRNALIHETGKNFRFSEAYQCVIEQMAQEDVSREATDMLALLKSALKGNPESAVDIEWAYRSVARALNNSSDAASAARAALQILVTTDSDSYLSDSVKECLPYIYMAFMERLDGSQVDRYAALLREAYSTNPISRLSIAYIDTLSKLSTDGAKAETAALRGALSNLTGPIVGAGQIAQTYMLAFDRLSRNDAQAEITALGATLENTRNKGPVSELALAYAWAAARFNDQRGLVAAATSIARVLRQPGKQEFLVLGAYLLLEVHIRDERESRIAVENLIRWLKGSEYSAVLAKPFNVVMAKAGRGPKRLFEAFWISQSRDISFSDVQLSFSVPFYEEFDFDDAYDDLVSRLDPEHRLEEARSLREFLVAPDDFYAGRDALAKSTLQSYYGIVFSRLKARDLQDELSRVSAQLIANPHQDDVLQVYLEMIKRLGQEPLKREVAKLQSAIRANRQLEEVGFLTKALGIALARISDTDYLHDVAAEIRNSSQQTSHTDRGFQGFALGSVTIEAILATRGGSKNPVENTKRILMLASQPYISEQDQESLLAALTPVAGRNFGHNLRAAADWAFAQYGISPPQLRPQSGNR